MVWKIGHSEIEPTGIDHVTIHTKGFKDIVMGSNFAEIIGLVDARERLILKNPGRFNE